MESVRQRAVQINYLDVKLHFAHVSNRLYSTKQTETA